MGVASHTDVLAGSAIAVFALVVPDVEETHLDERLVMVEG